MTLQVFKIKNKDGKFSTGSTNPRWTSRGKTWNSLQAIKLHLRQFCKTSGYVEGKWTWSNKWQNNIPEDWVVVEMTMDGLKEYSAKELYKLTEE